MKIRLTILLLTVSLSTFAVEPIYQFSDEQQAQRFQQLTESLRCVVCANESLAGSQAPIAKDLRQRIYDLLQAQQTDAEIKQAMVARYGDYILYQPPLDKQTWWLWAAPLLFCLIAAMVMTKLYTRRLSS